MKTPFKAGGALLTLLPREPQPTTSITRRIPETDKIKQRIRKFTFFIMPLLSSIFKFVFS
jgi:hypothetical protein